MVVTPAELVVMVNAMFNLICLIAIIPVLASIVWIAKELSKNHMIDDEEQEVFVALLVALFMISLVMLVWYFISLGCFR